MVVINIIMVKMVGLRECVCEVKLRGISNL